MIDAATVRRADVAVQSAAADIAQARAVLPTIPFIQEALVSGARRGVFVRVLAPGVMTGMLQVRGRAWFGVGREGGEGHG